MSSASFNYRCPLQYGCPNPQIIIIFGFERYAAWIITEGGLSLVNSLLQLFSPWSLFVYSLLAASAELLRCVRRTRTCLAASAESTCVKPFISVADARSWRIVLTEFCGSGARAELLTSVYRCRARLWRHFSASCAPLVRGARPHQ